MAIPLEPPRPRYWPVLAAVATVFIFCAVPAKSVEPEWNRELVGLTEITNIWLEDSATDGCWPNPKVTENLVIARLKAAGLSYSATPPKLPDFPEADDPEFDIKAEAYALARRAYEAWQEKRLYIYVQAYDMGITVNGNSVGAVTEARLMAAVIRRPEQVDEPIASLAGAPFPTVPPDADSTRLTRELSREVPAVLVADATGILGVLTRYDLLHYLMKPGEVRRGG